MLHCVAVGDPTPVVRWDKNNRVSSFDQRRFRVRLQYLLFEQSQRTSHLWPHQEFSFGGYSRGACGTGVPSGVQGRNPVGGLGIKSPLEAETVCVLFTDSDCRNDQNVKISHNSPPILD